MNDFIDLPATTDQQKTMPIGIHRMTIIKMEKAMDKNNQPILDNRNYPAYRIYFTNAAGDTIDSLFHYSTKPKNDPTRNDAATACKSEFRLHNLKRAMGFGDEPVKAEMIKGKFFYGMVTGEKWVHDANGEPVLRDEKDKNSQIVFNRLGSIFWPDNAVKPVKEGDPTNPASNGVASGDFMRPIKKKWEDVQKFLNSDKSGSGSGTTKKEYKDVSGSGNPGTGTAPSTPAPDQQQPVDFPEQPAGNDADW